MSHDRHADRVCACCARPAIGIGVAPSNVRTVSQILWLCDDPECLVIGQITMGMKQLEFNRIDHLAASEAAETMGVAIEAYCDQIGKTDLRELTTAEWEAMLKSAAHNAIGSYREALQTKLRNEAPF